MSDTPTPSSVRAALSGRWQVPLLGLGVLLFGGGLIRIAAAYQPVTFAEELQRVATLREAGSLRRASAYLLDLLKAPDRPPDQRGEVHRLLAATIYQTESMLSVHSARNVRSIIANFQSAVRHGVVPDAEDWVSVGDAYRWSQNPAESADAYRQSLRLSPRQPDRIRRVLIELEMASGRAVSVEAVGDLDAILEDASSSPGHYFWAVETKVGWLLEKGEAGAGLALVEAGKERLAGSAELPALAYTEALCLCEGGTRYSAEAETLLRSLLNNWAVRDELWARTNYLLGKLQQYDDRPQAAIALFDETMGVFQSGAIHDACTLGRAECLAMLERYERSLETFAGLKDRLPQTGGHRYLDRDAVRGTITAIGESLLQEGAVELGVAYLRLGLALVEASDTDSRAYYLSRIAMGLTAMARAAMAAPPSVEAAEQGKALLGKAAEVYLSLSKLQTLDEGDAAKSMELAADNFDAAGMTERVIEVLARFVVEHPTSDRRAAALHRLGQAHQALQRYPEAIATYERVIEDYPRLLDAHASMVPLAECLLAIGGPDKERGVALLISIVDDEGLSPLFDPRAQEYRDALVRLAEYYSEATEQEVPQHFEKAITRLEDAITLYPADRQVTKLQFLLADAYRQSGTALSAEAETLSDERIVEDIASEVARRLRRAMAAYERVLGLLAPLDASALTDLEQMYLRLSYLYRADCLFDLGRYEEAIASYNEAIWRYENLPAAISASMQIVHCHLRLGQMEEARAALERMGWLLKKIPASAFESERGMSSKQYWENMVARLKRTGLY